MRCRLRGAVSRLGRSDRSGFAGVRLAGPARARAGFHVAQAAESAGERRSGAVGDDRVADVEQVVGDDSQQPAPELTRACVLREHSYPVATDEAMLRLRAVAERRRVVVERDRPRREDAPPAGHACTPRQIRVLEVGEERGVEPADRVEHGASKERQRCTRSEDVDRLGLARARRFAQPALAGDAELVDLDSRRVDRVRPRGEPDLGCDRPDCRVAFARGEQLEQRIRIDGAVVVHERYPLALRQGEPRSDPAGEAELCAAGHHHDRRLQLLQLLLRGCGHVVEYDDQLALAVDARECRRELRHALLEEGRVAERHDDDREPHPALRPPRPRGPGRHRSRRSGRRSPRSLRSSAGAPGRTGTRLRPGRG